MKLNSIVYRYIFFELIPPFLVTLVFFTFLFLMTQILEITNLVVNYRLGLGSVFLMIMYSTPFFLQFIVPMSTMMAVLLTFLRLSNDNEIVCLKAGGVSIISLLPPVVLFCFVGWAITSFMSIYAMPNGKVALKALAIKAISSNINIGIKERTFIDKFDGVTLYVSKVDLKNKQLKDIFIEDQRDKGLTSTIVAPRAELYSDPENYMFLIRLFNGSINQVNVSDRSANTIQFETYDMGLDAKKTIKNKQDGPKDEEEMSIAELRKYIGEDTKKDDQYYLTLMEFHKKFSYPVACFALGILGLPLGIQSRTTKRSFGIGLGLFFYLFYYIMLTTGWVFGEAGVYPPVVGMWTPNVVTFGMGFFLLHRTSRERSLKLDAVFMLLQRISLRLFKKETASVP